MIELPKEGQKVNDLSPSDQNEPLQAHKLEETSPQSDTNSGMFDDTLEPLSEDTFTKATVGYEKFRKRSFLSKLEIVIPLVLSLCFFSVLIYRMTNKKPSLPLDEEFGEEYLPFEYRELRSKIRPESFSSGITWVHLPLSGLPSLSAAFQVKAGSIDEVSHTAKFPDGTAHLLEHSVFLPQTPAEKQLFTYWNAFTDVSQTQYHFSSTSSNFLHAMSIFNRDLFNFKENPKSSNEVSAVNSEFGIHSQRGYFKRSAVLAAIAENRDHPIFHLGYGNTKSLQLPNIPQQVKSFYDNLYAKSKVNILTLGTDTDLDPSNIRLLIEGINKRTGNNMVVESESGFGESVVSGPRIEGDTLILINHEESTQLSYHYYISLPPSNLPYLYYLVYLLEKDLSSVLIELKTLARGVRVSIDYTRDVAEVRIRIEPSRSSIERPFEMIKEIEVVLGGMERYVDERVWNEVLVASRTELYLVEKGDGIDRVGEWLYNFALSGRNKIFAGYKILETYRPAIISEIQSQFAKKGRYMFFLSHFDTTRTKQTVDLTTFVTTQTDKKVDYSKAHPLNSTILLDQSLPEYSIHFTAKTFNRGTLLDLLFPLSPKPSNDSNSSKLLYTYPNNPYQPSLAFLKSMKVKQDKKSSPKFLVTSFPGYFTAIYNTKYDVEMAALKFRLNAVGGQSKEEYLKLLVAESIARTRLRGTASLVSSYRGLVEVSSDGNKGIIFTLSSIAENLKSVIITTIRKLKNIDVSLEEHLEAIDYLYRLGTAKSDPFEDARNALERHLFPHLPKKDDYKDFVKRHYQWAHGKFDMPAFAVDIAHMETACDKSIKTSDVSSLLGTFEQKREGFSQVEPVEIKTNRAVLIRTVKSNPQSPNNAYYSCNELGRNSPRIASMAFILDRLLGDLAFDYLRNQKNLGYVAFVNPERWGKQMYFCIGVEGDKPITVIENEVENFLLIAYRYLHTLSEDEVKKAGQTLVSINRNPFTTLLQETNYHFHREAEGNSLDFLDQMKKHWNEVTKQQVVTLYEFSFNKDSKRVIAEAVKEEDLRKEPEFKHKMHDGSSVLEVIIN